MTPLTKAELMALINYHATVIAEATYEEKSSTVPNPSKVNITLEATRLLELIKELS